MKAPVEVKVDGYEVAYVRVLTLAEANALRAIEGTAWTTALIAMSLSDTKGSRRFPASKGALPSDEHLAEVEALDVPFAEAVATAAAAVTYGHRKKADDEGKAEAPAGGSSKS